MVGRRDKRKVAQRINVLVPVAYGPLCLSAFLNLCFTVVLNIGTALCSLHRPKVLIMVCAMTATKQTVT